ncbi:MAG: hydrogenase-1 expression HyaE [Alphaproteobacteria bacterium]
MGQAIINALVADGEAETVTAETVAAYLNRDPAKVTALFFTGDPEKKPETADVAVVVRELVRKNPEHLRLGVVARADEQGLMKVHGVTTLPSIAFFQGADHIETIARIQDWSVYQERLAGILAKTGHAPVA